MSVRIEHLNDLGRKTMAEHYALKAGFKETSAQYRALSRILQGALLALAFDDNDYTNMRQVCYMAECLATFMPEFKGRNTYTAVFVPCMQLLKELSVDD